MLRDPADLVGGALVSGPWTVEEGDRHGRQLFAVVRWGESHWKPSAGPSLGG